MEYIELKKKLIKQLEEQLEGLTGELLMEAEGNGIEFEFGVGYKTLNIKMTSVYDEEKNEYISEEYVIVGERA